MDEKKDTNTNFEIHREISRKKVPETIALLKQFEQQTSDRVFDASRQNLFVASFYFTLNPEDYLAQVKKHGLNIPDLATTIDPSKPPTHQITRFYPIYNFMYFSKMSERNVDFIEKTQFTFLSALGQAAATPNYPLFKLFLSKMNHLANTGNLFRYTKHVEEIFRLLEYARDLKTPLRHQLLSDSRYLNSCTYGGQFYHLADLEQQSLLPQELEMAGLIMLAISHLFTKNDLEFQRIIDELVGCLKAFKEDIKDTGLSESKSDHKFECETKLRKKVRGHMEAMISLLDNIRKIRFDKGIALANLVNDATIFRGNLMKRKYQLASTNLLALSNFKQKNFAAASRILSRLCEKALETPASGPKEQAHVASLSQMNNRLLRAPLAFNLFVSLYAQGEYGRAILVAETLTVTYGSNFRFWYYKGVCHFSLWQREAASERTKRLAEIDKALRDAGKLFERKRLSVLPLPEIGTDLTVQQQSLQAYRTLENESGGRHVVMAISSFENSLNILRHNSSKEALGPVSQRSIQRFKEYLNQAKTHIAAVTPRYLLSVLEHLTYLYLLANKPMQALKTILIATDAANLKLGPSESARFATYHLKMAQMIRNSGQLKSCQNTLEEALKTSEKEKTVISVQRDAQTFKIPAAFALKYNRLLTQTQTRDPESGRSCLSRLLEDFDRLPEAARIACEPLARNAMFFHYSRIEFSRDMLRQITNPLFDVSKYLLNKNGKSAGGF